METREILELVKNGSMSVEEAEGHFRRQPFEDMGYAKLDMHRKMRSGFPEVIFCSGKPDEFLVKIYQRMAEADGQAFGTRASGIRTRTLREKLYEMVRVLLRTCFCKPANPPIYSRKIKFTDTIPAISRIWRIRVSRGTVSDFKKASTIKPEPKNRTTKTSSAMAKYTSSKVRRSFPRYSRSVLSRANSRVRVADSPISAKWMMVIKIV